MLNALPTSIEAAITMRELETKTGMTYEQLRYRIKDAEKAKYVLASGESGKPAKYWLSSGGFSLVLNGHLGKSVYQGI